VQRDGTSGAAEALRSLHKRARACVETRAISVAGDSYLLGLRLTLITRRTLCLTVTIHGCNLDIARMLFQITTAQSTDHPTDLSARVSGCGLDLVVRANAQPLRLPEHGNRKGCVNCCRIILNRPFRRGMHSHRNNIYYRTHIRHRGVSCIVYIYIYILQLYIYK